MTQAVVDVPRVGASRNAGEVYKAFTSLGWSHSMTGYLAQDRSSRTAPKVRTLVFRWTRPAKPLYPAGITCQTSA